MVLVSANYGSKGSIFVKDPGKKVDLEFVLQSCSMNNQIMTDGIKILGAPIGSPDFKAQFLSKKASSIVNILNALDEFESLQLKLLLVRYLAFPSFNHLCRCLCPFITERFVFEIEKNIFNFLFR